MFHDPKTNQLYKIDGLESEEFDLLITLKRNGISDAGSKSKEKAEALLGKSIEIQKDTCHKISSSVD